MRAYYYLTIAVILIGLQVPALAKWNIPTEAMKHPVQPVLPVVQQKSDWPAEIPHQPVPAGDNTIIADKPIEAAKPARSFWTERTEAVNMTSNDYMKSAEDVKVMNQVVKVYPNSYPAGTVPEPGSILGLSAGIIGLFFQVGRMRKRA